MARQQGWKSDAGIVPIAIRSAMTAVPSVHGGCVELTVPAHADYLKLVRLTASFVAAQMSSDFERTEDLRLAVDELCATLIDLAEVRGCTISLQCEWSRRTVSVRCVLRSVDGRPPAGEAAVADVWRAHDADSPEFLSLIHISEPTRP